MTLNKFLLVFFLISFVLVVSSHEEHRNNREHHSWPQSGIHHPQTLPRRYPPHHSDHHEGHHSDHHEGHHSDHHEEHHHSDSHNHHTSPVTVEEEEEEVVSIGDYEQEQINNLPAFEEEEEETVEEDPCQVCVNFVREMHRNFSRPSNPIHSKFGVLKACQRILPSATCETYLSNIFNYLRTKQYNPHQLCKTLQACSVDIVSKVRRAAFKLNTKLNKLHKLMELRPKFDDNIMELRQKINNLMELRPKNKLMELRPKFENSIMELKQKINSIMELRQKDSLTDAMELRPSTIDAMELRPSTIDAMELKPKKIEALELRPKKIEAMELKPKKIEAMELKPLKTRQCKGHAPTRFHVCENGEWVLHYSLTDARLLALSGTGICLVLTLFTCLLCALRRRRSSKAKSEAHQPLKSVETI